MNPAVPLAALARTNAAEQQSQPHQGGPTYNANYPNTSAPGYQVYGQPNNQAQYPPQQYPQQYQQPYQQPPQYQAYQPYGQTQQPNQQYAPFSPPPPNGATAVPIQPDPYGGDGHQHQQQGGFFSNEKMDFGIPDDKLITEDLDRSIRHAFVRKVYSILSVQLLITFGMALMFNLWDAAGDWLFKNWWLMLVGMAVALVAIIVLTCVPGVARAHPWNLICLFIISIAFGITLGYACAAVSTSSFAIAAGITAGVSISLSIFACQTKWDFTGCGVFVFVTMIVLMIFGILCIFIRNKITHLVYASLGALLFSFYMVYDTQQIVGGKHRKFQYSIDDYVFAALTLYMDVINLFMFILSIVSAVNE